MTKGSINKPKTLGRFIFGEKRKQHASPSRHRSSTRTGESNVDLTAQAVAPPPPIKKKSINLHDWAVWRMQLNEQMASMMNERRSDSRSLRQYLQANPFYQQYSRDSSGRYAGVRLLFSIPRAKFRQEYLQTINPEIIEVPLYEQNNALQSHSDDRTTASVNSVSGGVPPVNVEKNIAQYLPRGLLANPMSFVVNNEPLSASEFSRNRPSMRCSYRASDNVHSTLQKAVKDGNVLEKIKAFEMQAAAAQAESTHKISTVAPGINHRMQSLAASIHGTMHRTLSPGSINPITSMTRPFHQQSMRSTRARYIPSNEYQRGDLQMLTSKKRGSHMIEPATGDVILKRRTPSQRSLNDEDYSLTAISSMALSSSRDHRRASVSRSRHRQDILYDRYSLSRHENASQQKQKRAITPSKATLQKTRWAKSEKNLKNESINPSVERQEVMILKSTKTRSSPKLAETNRETNNAPTDNNRVYGVPSSSVDDADKSEDISCDKLSNVPPAKLSSNETENPSKIEETPFSEQTVDRSESNGDEDNVFIEDKQTKTKANLPRHQSFVNGPQTNSVRYQQQAATMFRRHASQCSADEYSNERRFQRAKENGENFKKTNSPITILTRKHRVAHEDPLVYDTPNIEQNQMGTLKKKRSMTSLNQVGQNQNNANKQISKQILHAIMNSMNNIQDGNGTAQTSTADEFFDNGPLSNPEETMVRIVDSS